MRAILPLPGRNSHFQSQARRLGGAARLDGEDVIGFDSQLMFVGKGLALLNRQKAVAADQLQDQAAEGWKRQPARWKSDRDNAAGPSVSRLAQTARSLIGSDPDADRWQTNSRIRACLRRQGGGTRIMGGRHAASARRTTRLALMPPKAKELVSALWIAMGRATFGTASTGHLASASRQLMVGGATFSRTAPIVTISSSAPAAPSACPWMGFGEETGRFESRLPKTSLSASASVASLEVVPVPCALT